MGILLERVSNPESSYAKGFNGGFLASYCHPNKETKPVSEMLREYWVRNAMFNIPIKKQLYAIVRFVYI
jgi:hypothetical protein